MLFAVSYLILAAGIVASAIYYHDDYARSFRTSVERQLSSIAALKVHDLEQYRRERFRDAEVLFRNPAFSGLVQQAFDRPMDAAVRAQLQTWLAKYPDHLDYASISLLDAAGTPRMSIPASLGTSDAESSRLAAEVLAKGEIVFRDFYRNADNQRIYCSVLVPIIVESPLRHPLGLVVLQIDPQEYLYPTINRWPIPSETAESLLVRRDGNDAIFLNELKFRKGTALTRRIPLTRTDIAAVKAVLGQTGIAEGIDYRGVPVVAHLAPVPDSPWFLVARIDQQEIYAPLLTRSRQLVGFVIVLLLGAGTSLGFIWRQRSLQFFRDHARGAATLRKLVSHQEVLLSTIPDIVMELDAARVCTWSNRAGLEFFGADIVGQDVASHFEAEVGSKRALQPLFDGSPRLVHLETRLRRLDGETRILAWSCGAFEQSDGMVTGALASARDVTDHRQAEQSLAIRTDISSVFLATADDQTYGQVLRVILDAMRSPLGAFGYIDEAGTLVMPAVSAGEESPEQSPDRIDARQQLAQNEGCCFRAIREKTPHICNSPTTATSDSGLRLERQLCAPILLRGDAIGILLVANRGEDYTAADLRVLTMIADHVAPVLHARLLRQRHESELQQRNDELLRFTYTVSHDLKSPLVTVTTFLGYLEQDIRTADTDRIAKDFGFIRGAAIKMSRLLDELLELSRVGRTSNSSVEVRLQLVVNEAIELTAGRLADRGITVEVTDAPIVLFGDHRRLVEVFQNLLDNAAKFMGQQPEPRVEVGVTSTREGWEVFVRDNGIGVDPRHSVKLFGLFEKLDPHTEGTGMGLALVQRIVEHHGGKIWVESDGPGRGATFKFTLSRTRRTTEKEIVS